MRKAKLFLAVVAVVGGIGAVFAFKAKQNQFIYVPAANLPPNTTLCEVQKFGLTTLAVTTTTTWGTTDPTLPCIQLGVRQGN